MSPRAKRTFLTLFVLGIATGVIFIIATGGGNPPADPDEKGDNTTEVAQADDENATTTDDETTAPDAGEETADPEAADNDDDEESTEPAAVVSLEGLKTLATSNTGDPASIGTLVPSEGPLHLKFHRSGAGIDSVTLSKYWVTTDATRAAEDHWEAVANGEDTTDYPLPPDEERYVLQETRDLRLDQTYPIPILAAHSVAIDGTTVSLLGDVWQEIAPGSFVSTIVNEEGTPVLEISRTFSIDVETSDVTMRQALVNKSGQDLDVQLRQYGPCDLKKDRAAYMDRRRFRFGPQVQISSNPDQFEILSNDNDFLTERIDLVKRGKNAWEAEIEGDVAEVQEQLRLWPTDDSIDKEYGLGWFASSNRYFAIALHRVVDEGHTGDKSLDGLVEKVYLQMSWLDANKKDADVFSLIYSPTMTIAAGETGSLDLGIYCGQLEEENLHKSPLEILNLSGLVLYQLSSFCAICTFQWLAHLLLGFLALLHSVTGDWGVSIIILVLVVRTILHPITKKSQVNMQRFGKRMSALKPEIDRLKKRFGDDPKRMQQEQVRVMREHGVSPLHALGCLPMFLQTPIWIALYAGIYFSFGLRHEAAFYGVFQVFNDWNFLADLSSSDHFFYTFAEPTKLWFWNVTGINILPLLMGAVFFFQQKYLTPPPSASMSEDQVRMQKMMRIMMPIMFPLMLYSAPSGLLLYIMTSSFIGMLESAYIRRHVNEMEDDFKPGVKKKKKTKANRRDPQARAYDDAIRARRKAAVEKQRQNYKKRK